MNRAAHVLVAWAGWSGDTFGTEDAGGASKKGSTMTKATAKSISATLLLAMFSFVCLGQEPPTTMLLIEFENNVQYN